MTRIEYLVAHPYEVEKSDIPLLKKEVEKYPYFYTLRALLLYGLKKENHPSFEDYLNKTSIHSSNRVDLYHYLNSEQVEKNVSTKNEEVSEEIQILETETTEEPVSILEEESKLETIETTAISIEEVEVEEIIEANSSTTVEVDENPTIEVEEVKIQEIDTTPIEQDSTLDVDIENAIQQTSEIERQVQEESNKNENIIITKEEVITEEINIENLDINSTHSFSDWLKRFPSQQKDEKTLAEEQEIAEREIKYKLIDDFLEKNPKIVPMKKAEVSPVNSISNFSQNSEEYSDLMTETLAQIYIEQKKYDKAIKAYKILILKYPEKNGLFANRIKEIENLKNSK